MYYLIYTTKSNLNVTDMVNTLPIELQNKIISSCTLYDVYTLKDIDTNINSLTSNKLLYKYKSYDDVKFAFYNFLIHDDNSTAKLQWLKSVIDFSSDEFHPIISEMLYICAVHNNDIAGSKLILDIFKPTYNRIIKDSDKLNMNFNYNVIHRCDTYLVQMIYKSIGFNETNINNSIIYGIFKSGSVQLLEWFITNYSLTLNHLTDNDITPFMFALADRNIDIIKFTVTYFNMSPDILTYINDYYLM
jgi:hypothetical protein